MSQKHILISTCISLNASEKCLLVPCFSSSVYLNQFAQWAVGLFLIILKEPLNIRNINPLANVLQMFFPVSNIAFWEKYTSVLLSYLIAHFRNV